ncbi:hypothetical protein [Crocinitomix catalasitica]|uniref:hypothetical protein n=1 Tax=Crocinitomix catalasitica TaxID=184607 RepID=UPI000483ED55|nr:hypothetical protein [Crocinitomix catalasitica]
MKHIFYSFFLGLLFANCAGVYIPPAPQIPLFREAKELNSDLGISTNSLYLNTGYSFTDKYAAIANVNVSYRNLSPYYDISNLVFKELDISGGNEYKHSGAEFALGRYWSKPTSFWVSAVFAGFGLGTSAYETTIPDQYNTNNYLSGHIMYDIGYERRIFSIGFSAKLFYNSIDVTYKEGGFEAHKPINLYGGQLGGKIRIGKKRVFFFIAGALTMSSTFGATGGPGFSNSNLSTELFKNFLNTVYDAGSIQTRLSPHSPAQISIGISLRI